MSEELADSGSEESSFDMEAAVDQIGQDVFGAEPVVKTEENEEVQEAGKEPEEKTEEQTEEKPEEVKEEVTTRPAPQSWKKEMHEFWNGLDPSVQAYVEQRENQMKEGLEKDRGDANLGRTMRDVLQPYEPALKQHGIDPQQMVGNLLNAQFTLANGTQEQRTQLIHKLAQDYGVPMNGETPQVDPQVKALQDEINGIKYNLSASEQRSQQEARDRVNAEVEAFASDPEHEFFDEVSEQIIPLINAGYTLEDAYNNAIWLNPVTRQKEIDRTAKEAAEKAALDAKQEVEKAKKAKAANVRGRDTSKSSTEPTGTMEDTMRDVYREIQNRSH